MQLEKAINKLLYTNDCVTIPSFGSFIINFFPSNYDKTTGNFYPPSRRISFNPKIKNNDGLLINFISNQKKITFGQASKKVNDQVYSWKEILKNGTLILENIGEFSYNDEENITFEPDLNYNHLLDSYGLPVLFHKKSELKPKVIELNSESNKKKSFSLIKNAAALALIVSSTIFFNNRYESYVLEQNINFENQKRIENINRVENAIFDFGSIPAIELNLQFKSKVNKYHIIAGAFGIKSNAENLYADLQKKGYNPTKLPLNEKGLLPVSFDSFKDKKTAVKALRKFQKTENKDAWLFILD